jgi:hypothetical protein
MPTLGAAVARSGAALRPLEHPLYRRPRLRQGMVEFDQELRRVVPCPYRAFQRGGARRCGRSIGWSSVAVGEDGMRSASHRVGVLRAEAP